MKRILFAAAALSLLAVAPASAQMMGGMGSGMGMGGGMGGGSCVSGGQFVACPPPGGMQPMMNGRMDMQDQQMRPRKMTRREMRMQRRMMKDQDTM